MSANQLPIHTVKKTPKRRKEYFIASAGYKSRQDQMLAEYNNIRAEIRAVADRRNGTVLLGTATWSAIASLTINTRLLEDSGRLLTLELGAITILLMPLIALACLNRGYNEDIARNGAYLEVFYGLKDALPGMKYDERYRSVIRKVTIRNSRSKLKERTRLTIGRLVYLECIALSILSFASVAHVQNSSPRPPYLSFAIVLIFCMICLVAIFRDIFGRSTWVKWVDRWRAVMK